MLNFLLLLLYSKKPEILNDLNDLNDRDLNDRKSL